MSKVYETPPGYTDEQWNALSPEEQEAIVGGAATEPTVTTTGSGSPTVTSAPAPPPQSAEDVERQRQKAKDDPGQPESHPVTPPVALDSSEVENGRSATEIANAAARGQVFPKEDEDREAGAPPVATAGP